ncbi:MAG: TrkA family potassium uptake protein [Candidatus Sumerlaeota bacterium]|nr:TrkA family potassium uptake protein [Candidatus Sumerlaeota bacterium]
MKQICVIGLGNFGSHFARMLAHMGCEVLAIDNSEANVAAIRDDVHQALIADARNFEALQSAIPPDVDAAVISLGDDLAASILCALHLKQIGVASIYAKAANEDHQQILRALGITRIFFPERETAERMAFQIVRPNLLDFFPLGEDYEVHEIPVPRSFIGQTMVAAQIRSEYQALVIAIKNAATGEARFMPPATQTFGEGDVLVVMGKPEDLQRLAKA